MSSRLSQAIQQRVRRVSTATRGSLSAEDMEPHIAKATTLERKNTMKRIEILQRNNLYYCFLLETSSLVTGALLLVVTSALLVVTRFAIRRSN